MEKEKRSNIAMIRLGPEEQKRIMEFAEIAGITMSEYFRLAVEQRIMQDHDRLKDSVQEWVRAIAPEVDAESIGSSIIEKLGPLKTEYMCELPDDMRKAMWQTIVTEAIKQDEEAKRLRKEEAKKKPTQRR